VDGGNSKADVALVDSDGTLLALVHGATISHQAVGLERGMANLAALVGRAAKLAGIDVSPRVADRAVYCLAGVDYASDILALRRAIEGLALSPTAVVLNDTFAALRAGSRRPWGVALICGQGTNACAVAPSGRSARFDAVGAFSGDWGGATDIGLAGVAAAARGADGRGPKTALQRIVPAHFSLRTPAALTRALYLGAIDELRLTELAPVVFEAASAGDSVARSIIDRLADELATMAAALIRRLGIGRTDPDVVLAGGVFRATDAMFYERLETGIHAAAPRARLVRLAAPPVLGAALLGLDAVELSADARGQAESRLRAEALAREPGRD
jgi:N-acetylglucosamine kinase-like BadF-type ATPase